MAVVEVLGGLNGGGRMRVDGLVGWFGFFFFF